MKTTFTLILLASLALVGCDKKKDPAPKPAGSGSAVVPTGSGSAAPTGSGSAAPTGSGSAAPTAGKSCADLGGTADGATRCTFKATAPQPFDAVYTGKFEGTMMRPEPGAVFKVTNKFDRPVTIQSAQAYVYDKDGKQLEFVVGTDKLKYAQDSSGSLLEINAGETKDFIHSMGKENLPPEADTVQVEFLAWKTADGMEFSRNVETDQFDVRPKDGWK
jgi:uncharacterized protein YcfL